MLAHLGLDIAVHDMSTDEPHGARVMGPEAIARSKESRGKVGADGCRQGPASGPCQSIRERVQLPPRPVPRSSSQQTEACRLLAER